jgi:hypothetical protein
MSLAWVAGSVRAGLLTSRRVGRAGARTVAGRGSLADALRDLAGSPYGRELEGARSLPEAQHAVAATVLWNLRVLSGWLPPAGDEVLRALAAWFEIANVQDRLAYLAAETYLPPFELGGLATAWPALARTGSPEAVRAVLADSRWGDPDGAEPLEIAAGMRAAWAARVAVAAPEAAGWSRAAAALALAREGSRGGARLAGIANLGDGPPGGTPAELAARLPSDLSWVLAGVDGPDDLWLAEARWWSRVEEEAARLAAARRQGPSTVVGAVGLLAADAWRVRAAVAAAALGAADEEAFDAVA